MDEADIILNGKWYPIRLTGQAHLKPEYVGGVIVIDKMPRTLIEAVGKARALTHEERRKICGPPLSMKGSSQDWPNAGVIRQGFREVETRDVLRTAREKPYEGTYNAADFYQGGKLVGTISGNAVHWTPEAQAERDLRALIARGSEIIRFCVELSKQSFRSPEGESRLPGGQDAWYASTSAGRIAAAFGGETAHGGRQFSHEEKRVAVPGDAEFALVGMRDGEKNGRFLVDWRSRFYGQTEDFVLDRLNPEDQKRIESIYGPEKGWLHSPVDEPVMSVYQARNTRESMWDPVTSFDPAKYVKVAEVSGNDFALVFEITNSGSPLAPEIRWCDLKDPRLRVIPVSEEDRRAGFFARSTSIGDVVVIHQKDNEANGLAYACVSAGWNLVPCKEVADLKTRLAGQEKPVEDGTAKYLLEPPAAAANDPGQRVGG